ncbi:hypothetical protein D3C72_1827400 [compost metagenome]
MVGEAKHVHFDAGGHQRNDGVHVLRYAGRGVERDGGPHRVRVLFRYAVALEKRAGGVRTVHLEALVLAAMAGHQTDVMEHGAGIEQFAVERQAALYARQRAKVIDAA